MGIKSLHKLLKKQAAEAYREISLSEYSFRKVAVDASLFLYKYKAAAGDRWLSALLNLIMCLRRNEVHCFFVYDGKPPDEKIAEKERRAGEKEKLREKVAAVEYALNLYTRTGEVEQILLDITARRKKSPTKVKRLMGKEKAIDKFYLERYLERLKNQVVSLSAEDIVNSQTLLTLLGVPFCTSETEAETLCAFMSLTGKVDAVMSDDTDVIAYGSPFLLHKIDTTTGKCISLSLEGILESTGFSLETFRDLCIMCGTDYNTNIRKVGPVNSFKLLQEYESIDNLPEKYDKTCLNHLRVRELFTTFDYEIPEPPFCSEPVWEELGKFLFTHRCQYSLDRIKKDLGRREVSFE